MEIYIDMAIYIYLFIYLHTNKILYELLILLIMSTKVYETTTKTATAIIAVVLEFVADVLRGNCFLFHLLRYCTEVNNNVNNITA